MPMAISSTGERVSILDHLAQVALEIVAGLTDSVESSTGAPSEITIRILRCSGRRSGVVRPEQRLAVDVFLQQALAHHQAEIAARAPPGRVGRLVDDVAQVVEPARGGGLPSFSHFSRACPPFQARVVKPRISTLTPQRSSVRARMSAQIAATVIGRPRIEPELSSSSVTTVSRNFGVASPA
jgi:hypothetical protein